MPSRKQNPILAKFEQSKAGTDYKAICNKCEATMQSIPARTKNQIDILCRKSIEKKTTNVDEEEDIRIVAIRAASSETTELTRTSSQ